MEEIETRKRDRKYKKILRMRKKHRTLKRIQQKIIATIVTIKGDNRFFARAVIGGQEALALLDSGACSSCLGKGAMRFLEGKENRITRLSGQNVRTANGGKTPVVGVVSLPVTWDGETRDLEFLIVPELTQEVYLGIDFWRVFQLNVVGKSVNESVHDRAVSELVPAEGDLSFDAVQHSLTMVQSRVLDRVKAQFPSFAVLGLGRTDVEEHIIEVVEENIPIKQRHYPISPAIQKLVYEELDRMLSMVTLTIRPLF